MRQASPSTQTVIALCFAFWFSGFLMDKYELWPGMRAAYQPQQQEANLVYPH